MANLRKQKEALVSYFESGCKPAGQLTVGLEVEHFITGADGSPVQFEQIQQVLQALQQTGDVPVVMDGEYWAGLPLSPSPPRTACLRHETAGTESAKRSPGACSLKRSDGMLRCDERHRPPRTETAPGLSVRLKTAGKDS